MPNYVTITPKYQVIDLADMLKVPEMLNKERQEQEDKYNENLDKLAAIEAMADESTRYRLQNYRNSLENAANALIGRQGTIADTNAYMNQARQYYRDAMPIINAYERKQKEQDVRRQILANDPSARFTELPDLETYIKNPNQDWYHFSGDKVYDKALNSAKLISQDRIIRQGLGSANRYGFVKEESIIGYTPEEQKKYADLIRKYDLDPNDESTLNDLNSPLYKQLFEDYKGMLQDNLSHNYSTDDREWGKQKILDGQLVGMKMQSDAKYHTDPIAVARATQERTVKDDDKNIPLTSRLATRTLYRKLTGFNINGIKKVYNKGGIDVLRKNKTLNWLFSKISKDYNLTDLPETYEGLENIVGKDNLKKIFNQYTRTFTAYRIPIRNDQLDDIFNIVSKSGGFVVNTEDSYMKTKNGWEPKKPTYYKDQLSTFTDDNELKSGVSVEFNFDPALNALIVQFKLEDKECEVAIPYSTVTEDLDVAVRQYQMNPNEATLNEALKILTNAVIYQKVETQAVNK